MEVDKDARKRLNMDDAGTGLGNISGAPKATLAITNGSGLEATKNKSPASSDSSNKRLKVSKGGGNNEISAASLKEDRRT